MFPVSFQGSTYIRYTHNVLCFQSSMFPGNLSSRVLFFQDPGFSQILSSQVPLMFLGFLGCFQSCMFPGPLVSRVLSFHSFVVPGSYVSMVLFPASYVPRTFTFHGFHDLLDFPGSRTCFQVLMLRLSYIPRFYVPSTFNSQTPMFPVFYVPLIHILMMIMFFGSRNLCSQDSLWRSL